MMSESGVTANQAWLGEVRRVLATFPAAPERLTKAQLVAMARKMHRACELLVQLLGEAREDAVTVSDALMAIASSDVPIVDRDLMVAALNDAITAAHSIPGQCADCQAAGGTCPGHEGQMSRAADYEALAAMLRDAA
jgi:hypothetical protein